MTVSPRSSTVHVDSRDALDVRRFAVEQRMSSLFEVKVTAVSHDADIDFDGVVAAARWQGRAEQMEKPSSSRRENGGAGSPYNRQNREVGRRGEGDGRVRSVR